MLHSNRLIHAAFCFLSALMLSLPTFAVTPIDKKDPQQMLKDATSQILDIALAAKQKTPPDSESYYQKVDELLSQIIDLDYFTRGVMATHASARRYKSLTSEAEKAAFRARIEKFGAELKRSLIRTYADALLSFNGERIAWEPPPAQEKDAEHRILTQIIHAAANKEYKVQYRLVRKDSGDWLVQNVIVEGLNMGETYRNQFADAVEKNKGDVDYVVNHWAELMKPAKVPEKKS